MTPFSRPALPTGRLNAILARFSPKRKGATDDQFSPARHLWFGAFICVVLIVGFGGWTVFASLQSAVVAQGVVTAEGRTRAVQHLDGGIITAILVRDGDKVAAGDVLVRLDYTRLLSELSIIENRLYEALTRQARLEAERDDAPAIKRPSLLDAIVSSDRTRVDRDITLQARTGADIANRVLQGQERLFVARRETLKAQVERLQASIAQSREQISGVEAQRASAQRQRELVARDLKNARTLYDKGLLPLPRVLEFERQEAELEGNVAGRVSDKAAIEQQIGQFQLQILELTRDTREKVLTELREADSNVQDLLDQRIAALDQLNRTEIRAPVSGRVNDLAVHTVGGVIKPADVVMQIVPDDEALIVEARADPASIDQLKIGQPARIRLSAFDQRTTPELAGELMAVSPDRVRDPQSGASYYALKVSITEAELDRLHRDQILTSGMPADVFVVTGSRSPLSYLTKPLTDQIMRALREE